MPKRRAGFFRYVLSNSSSGRLSASDFSVLFILNAGASWSLLGAEGIIGCMHSIINAEDINRTPKRWCALANRSVVEYLSEILR